MQRGKTPSVSDAAEAAGVSRATAYRYFPTQSALVEAVVDHALGPILQWDSTSQDAEERVQRLAGIVQRPDCRVRGDVQGGAGVVAGTMGADAVGCVGPRPAVSAGPPHRTAGKGAGPVARPADRGEFSRLAKALSLTFGLEVILVLKDIWKVDVDEMQELATWAARSLVRAALAEADQSAAA